MITKAPRRTTHKRCAAMITSCARIMAMATIATIRCSSFLYSGSRIYRTGARGGKQFSALHMSSTQHVEHSAQHQSTKSRGNADDASLDTLLISNNPELVVDHMKARRMGEDSVEAVHRIGGTSPGISQPPVYRQKEQSQCNVKGPLQWQWCFTSHI